MLDGSPSSMIRDLSSRRMDGSGLDMSACAPRVQLSSSQPLPHRQCAALQDEEVHEVHEDEEVHEVHAAAAAAAASAKVV